MNFVFSNIFSITFCKKKSSNDGQYSAVSFLDKDNMSFYKITTLLFIGKLPLITENGGIFSCNVR